MPDLQALIFDADGTIAETERDGHRLAFNQAFAAAGLDWHWDVEEYGQLLAIAGGKERLQFYHDRRYRDRPPPPEIPAEPTAEWLATLHQAKSGYYQQLVQTGKIPLRPGIRRLLHAARAAGLRLAIATTSAPRNAIALLQTALAPDSPDWFEVIAAGDIVAQKKPAPDIYQYVLTQMQLEPAHCLVFEDSDQGLTAAVQAGLKTVVTQHDYTRHQDFTAATLVLNHLGEPDHPFTAIAGDVGTATYFDLELAQQLCSSSTSNHGE